MSLREPLRGGPSFSDPYTPPTGTFSVVGSVSITGDLVQSGGVASFTSNLAAGSASTDFTFDTANTRTAGSLFAIKNHGTTVLSFSSSATADVLSVQGSHSWFTFRTTGTAFIDMRTDTNSMNISYAPQGTLNVSYIRDSGRSYGAVTTTGAIKIGYGRLWASGVQGYDTYTATAETNQGYLQVLPVFTPNAGAFAVNIAAMMINPTFNATAIASGNAAALAIAPVFTAWAGGVPYVLDSGVSTTDYFTGYTQYFAVLATAPTAGNTVLKIRYHNGAAATTQLVTLGAADSGGAGFKLLRVPN